MGRQHAYLGIDVGSISTKGVIIDKQNNILASAYIWTQGDPIGAVKILFCLWMIAPVAGMERLPAI